VGLVQRVVFESVVGFDSQNQFSRQRWPGRCVSCSTVVGYGLLQRFKAILLHHGFAEKRNSMGIPAVFFTCSRGLYTPREKIILTNDDDDDNTLQRLHSSPSPQLAVVNVTGKLDNCTEF